MSENKTDINQDMFEEDAIETLVNEYIYSEEITVRCRYETQVHDSPITWRQGRSHSTPKELGFMGTSSYMFNLFSRDWSQVKLAVYL